VKAIAVLELAHAAPDMLLAPGEEPVRRLSEGLSNQLVQDLAPILVTGRVSEDVARPPTCLEEPLGWGYSKIDTCHHSPIVLKLFFA